MINKEFKENKLKLLRMTDRQIEKDGFLQ